MKWCTKTEHSNNILKYQSHSRGGVYELLVALAGLPVGPRPGLFVVLVGGVGEVAASLQLPVQL